MSVTVSVMNNGTPIPGIPISVGSQNLITDSSGQCVFSSTGALSCEFVFVDVTCDDEEYIIDTPVGPIDPSLEWNP